jgi:nitrogen fixation protein
MSVLVRAKAAQRLREMIKAILSDRVIEVTKLPIMMGNIVLNNCWMIRKQSIPSMTA